MRGGRWISIGAEVLGIARGHEIPGRSQYSIDRLETDRFFDYPPEELEALNRVAPSKKIDRRKAKGHIRTPAAVMEN